MRCLLGVVYSVINKSNYVVKNMSKNYVITQIALYAAAIAVLGMLPKVQLPVSGVPITLQSLGIMLAGAMLGPYRGFLSVSLFVIVVILGAPFLAGGRGGLAVFELPSVGFILGFPFAAYSVGCMMKILKKLSIFWAAFISSIFGGVFVLYIPGVIGVAVKMNLGVLEALIACLMFVPGDFIKAIIVAFILKFVNRVLPSAISSNS